MCAAIQRDRNRLQKLADRNLTKKGKWKVLCLGRKDPMHQYRLVANWMESGVAGKALEILVIPKLTMTRK